MPYSELPVAKLRSFDLRAAKKALVRRSQLRFLIGSKLFSHRFLAIYLHSYALGSMLLTYVHVTKAHGDIQALFSMPRTVSGDMRRI